MFGGGWIKTNQDFELQIFDHCMFAFGIQESFVMPLVGATHHVLNHSKQTRNEMREIWGQIQRRVQSFLFPKKLKQTITHPLPCVFSFASGAQRTFVTLQFAHPMTQKNCSIWFRNEENIGKCTSTCSMTSDSSSRFFDFKIFKNRYLWLSTKSNTHPTLVNTKYLHQKARTRLKLLPSAKVDLSGTPN